MSHADSSAVAPDLVRAVRAVLAFVACAAIVGLSTGCSPSAPRTPLGSSVQPPRPGTIVVYVNPIADVWVDGERRDPRASATGRALSVAPGSHRVTVRLRGVTIHDRFVWVPSGESRTLVLYGAQASARSTYRVRARARVRECEPRPESELDAAVCLAMEEGDTFAVIRLLEGRARTRWQLETLIESCRARGRSECALRHMLTYVSRYPMTPRARQYQQVLDARRPY